MRMFAPAPQEEFVMAKDELSGADIKAVCTEAGLLALRERRMRVTQVGQAGWWCGCHHHGNVPLYVKLSTTSVRDGSCTAGAFCFTTGSESEFEGSLNRFTTTCILVYSESSLMIETWNGWDIPTKLIVVASQECP